MYIIDKKLNLEIAKNLIIKNESENTKINEKSINVNNNTQKTETCSENKINFKNDIINLDNKGNNLDDNTNSDINKK